MELNGIGFENAPENRYKFQGKEKLDWIGWIDFGNRMYDPTRGQFTSVDALADHPNQVRFSPYTAFWNNPVRYTDPDGNCPSCPQGEEAAKLYAAGANVTNKDGSWTWTGKEWQDAPMVSQYKPDMADNWSSGNFGQRLAYGIADGVYSMFADNHLGGKGFDSYDDKIKTKLGGLMTLGGPLLSGESAAANVADDIEKQILYHYTNEAGMNGIVNSGSLRPSLRALNPKDVRYGEGQYLSDIIPGTKTARQLSSSFIRVANPYKYTHYVGIDVTGLGVQMGRDAVYVVPNTKALDISKRIVSYGKN